MGLREAIILVLRNINGIRLRIINFPKAISMAASKTYYPEKEGKSYIIKVVDNLKWLIKYGEFNSFYTLYGLDLKDCVHAEQYKDYIAFMRERNAMNRIGTINCQVNILRDKLAFYKFFRSTNIAVPEVFGVIKNGLLYNVNFEKLDVDMINERYPFFIKEIDGECASFVKKIRNACELEECRQMLTTGGYILQTSLNQSEAMNVVNSNSVNTLRIVTVYSADDVFVLCSLLRIGTKATGNVDNWAAGGLAVGVNADGSLKKYGYYKPVHGAKTIKHPDSGVIFSEFTIPMYKEACRLVCNAHRQLYGIKVIGWDVAITDDSPVIIEGNDNFEISLHQAVDGPLRKEWQNVLTC